MAFMKLGLSSTNQSLDRFTKYGLGIESKINSCDAVLRYDETHRLEVDIKNSESFGGKSTDKIKPIGVHWRSLLKGPPLLNREPLKKALGRPLPADPIVDGTCGLGEDCALFLRSGLRVIGIEGHWLLFELLESAWKAEFPDDERLELKHGDSSRLFANWSDLAPSIIYLDPMFPEKTKSALTNIKMRFIQSLMNENPPCSGKQLFEEALKLATKRVIVKRPLKAKPIGEVPTVSYSGKSVRYDVYVKERNT